MVKHVGVSKVIGGSYLGLDGRGETWSYHAYFEHAQNKRDQVVEILKRCNVAVRSL